MNEYCPTKTLLVDIQENGVIRRADTGYIIGRLRDNVPYEDLPGQSEKDGITYRYYWCSTCEKKIISEIHVIGPIDDSFNSYHYDYHHHVEGKSHNVKLCRLSEISTDMIKNDA